MNDLKGRFPESWRCVDCGFNTAPGLKNRAEIVAMYSAISATPKGVEQTIDDQSEVYTVRPAIWKAARMDEMGGCLCIGCIEKRLGRELRPKDFDRKHPFHGVPGTPRLLKRRGD